MPSRKKRPHLVPSSNLKLMRSFERVSGLISHIVDIIHRFDCNYLTESLIGYDFGFVECHLTALRDQLIHQMPSIFHLLARDHLRRGRVYRPAFSVVCPILFSNILWGDNKTTNRIRYRENGVWFSLPLSVVGAPLMAWAEVVVLKLVLD